MPDQGLVISRDNAIVTATIDRPPANAMNHEVVSALSKLLDEAERDKSIRVIIITGAGRKMFSAGGDVKSFPVNVPVEQRDAPNRFSGIDLEDRFERFPKPIIAAINGACVGGGNELAMACAIRIAVESARFGQPEINLGHIPGWGGIQRLVRLIGKGRASELLLTGGLISSREALALGLVNKVVPDDELMPKAKSVAHRLERQPPLALAVTKTRIIEGLEQHLHDAVVEDMEECNRLFKTKDSLEGVRAFIEKRQPNYIGE